MSRNRIKRRDGNHAEIVQAFQRCGYSVLDLSQVGDGCPDLLVGKRGHNTLVEIKMPSEKLQPHQRAWHNIWNGGVPVVMRSVEAVLRFAGVKP